MRKKAQLGTLQTIIITLVMIGIVLAIGFLILESFRDTLRTESAVVSNETITAFAGTPCKYVASNSTTPGIQCYGAFTPIEMRNATGAQIVAPGNYTYNTRTGQICLKVDSTFNTTNVNLTYSYEYGKGSCEGVQTTVGATAKIPVWLSIIVILMIVGILLAIVFNVLPRMVEGRGTVAEI